MPHPIPVPGAAAVNTTVGKREDAAQGKNGSVFDKSTAFKNSRAQKEKQGKGRNFENHNR